MGAFVHGHGQFGKSDPVEVVVQLMKVTFCRYAAGALANRILPTKRDADT